MTDDAEAKLAEQLYNAAEGGWGRGRENLMLYIAAAMDDTVCGGIMDQKPPCGKQPDHNGPHSPMLPCCRKSRDRCSCVANG